MKKERHRKAPLFFILKNFHEYRLQFFGIQIGQAKQSML